MMLVSVPVVQLWKEYPSYHLVHVACMPNLKWKMTLYLKEILLLYNHISLEPSWQVFYKKKHRRMSGFHRTIVTSMTNNVFHPSYLHMLQVLSCSGNQQTSGVTGIVLHAGCCTHATGRGDVYLVVYGDIQGMACQTSWCSMSLSNVQKESLVEWHFTVGIGPPIAHGDGPPLFGQISVYTMELPHPSLSFEVDEQMVWGSDDCCSV